MRSRIPMFWKVVVMEARPVTNMLKVKKYPVPTRNTATMK
jgi:hypothetical protein